MAKKSQGLGDRDSLFFLIGFAVGLPVLAFIAQVEVGTPLYDVYSLELTGIDGLGDPAGLGALAFNVTLHVRKKWLLVVGNRFSHGQVVVSYDGVAIGEGRVPGFSAAARSTAEVKTVVRGGRADMVQMPGGLVGRRVVAELRWGSAEFDVEAKLFRNGQEERGPVVLWCKVGSQVPQQPAQCLVFTDFRTGSPLQDSARLDVYACVQLEFSRVCHLRTTLQINHTMHDFFDSV